ncbi:hypothetical protein [uncultured Thermanaerothrix sp.]|uniref:hypothetical protein n=1 Tax=uncultured Thermanaerothrix sp. TaxID=1195149 RepID=UPI002622C795|nr:hypothetical protein [uncultured Thermanaerothrix sp.]
MRYAVDFEGRTVTYTKTATEAEVSRLFCAAVVSKRFREQLLEDPLLAVAQGYNGESFNLLPDTLEHLSHIRADSLSDFAAQFLAREAPVQVEFPISMGVR